MLVTVDNVLTPDELALARDLLNRSESHDGAITAGSQAALAKNNQQLAEGAQHLPALRQLVLSALERSPIFFTAALPLKILPPFFNRYAGQTNAYGFHTDGAMRMSPHRAQGYVRSDVSATLFLSEPNEYEGGELTIEDTFGTHGVKLRAGSLVLYPSSSVHAVSPVSKGQRLACFMFIQSMVRDAAQRRLLYDMDIALMRLRQTQGESDPIVRLTGIYHNLLRNWADS